MSGQEADTPNKGEVSSDQEVVGRDPDRRVRTLSRKALENEIDQKHREANVVHKMLKDVIRSTEGINEGSDLDEVLRDLEGFSGELNIKLQEIRSLYAQDKHNYFGDVEVRLVEESLTLDRALKLIQEIKSRQSDKLLETSSRLSRHSRRSKSSAGSSRASSARMKALAEAAAARESADYEKMVAEKEHERKQREAEIERTRQQERAEHAKELAIIAAEKKVAIAHAKLKAIEQAINEEENEENAKIEIEGIPKAKSDERTSTLVHSFSPPEIRNSTEQSTLLARGPERQENTPLKGISGTPRTKLRSTPNQREDNGENSRHVLPQSFIASTPINITGSQLIESLTSANQQIVSGLARQNLPKCHPDTFSGDPTLFHPWKAAFKAMISDVNVYPVQEINYLRSFTSGEAQKLVDNYRKRKQHDPGTLLNDLWGELERRFGSAAVITKELLERLNKTAAFSENENAKLQEFADLCADVDSQLTYLPGLACLNFPNTIQPIAEKLPLSLRGKWEKEIARYSEKNGDEYPGFRVFSKVVLRHSRIKNNPNILAGATHTPNGSSTSPNRRVQSKRTLKTNTGPASVKLESAPPKIEETKRCPFHERGGHSLEECKAFGAKPLEEKTDWILKAGLCYRCLSEGHRASDCRKKIQCSICKDDRHIALLHKERPRRFAASTEIVDTKCTLACKPIEGGLSCSKLLLVDVKNKEKPDTLHRIYAIVDEQSNSSLISSELADELGAVGPEEKYLLTTCSGEKEIKYGRRVAGVAIQSLNGVTSDLPTLIECDSIPHDKREIPTPEMARRFPHLHEIAGEIPPLDPNADIHLLLGRDAPELLKVREFKNGPKGAPWAQKLSLGWTIIGQMCLDIVGGPAHVLACRTSLLSANNGEPWKKHMEPEHYELIPCPNQFRIKESFSERREDPENDIFRTTREDNDVSLSCEDRKFIEIMETGINKNDSGNWEMPLPFRHKDTKMPNNRSQAVNRLNGLIRTLRKKPQMEKDYLEFMQKILDKGHASPAQPANSQSGRVWYLPHFGVYHPKKPTQIRVVFDSSAEFGGVSLNKELLPGPDLMNSLLGVLIRFRKETTAVMCDIEQMFHSFHVDPSHRNFLRFLWFEDNTPGKPITEYRMNVHLFGNGPSPAVATFGLRRTASDGEEKFGKEAAQFVHRNFYVDDGLASLPTGEQAMTVIIQTVQEEAFGEELKLYRGERLSGDESRRERISEKKSEMKKSALYRLDPFVDDNGILRIGGRLRRARLEYKEKHPVLLPKGYHVSKLIVRHYHGQVHHQGRQITHGAIRQAGYWLVDGNHEVAKELSLCVLCKKLRGPRLEQRMADLPADRVEATPPFTNVGFDVFGPWLIQTRKTRGGTTGSKRWGLVFTRLSSRAVHIEVLESMDTSSFICALRRFFALRGPASLLRCDRGTNFIGGKSELDEAMKEMDQRRLERYVKEQGCEWRFNPPYASHFGGTWERQIGTIRRVLDAMFLELGGSQLTHELLVTLMAGVTAIVNARPITTVLSDTEEPEPLSPSMLLTMKTRPLGPPPGEFLPVDLYSRRRWRRVQYLADQFWLRWRREYMQTLQSRSKWNSSKRNLNAGDIVLVKEDGAHRNNWPLGLISEAIKSEDGAVRKAQVLLWREGKKKTFLRPIKELVLLVPVQADGMQPTEHRSKV